MYYENRMYSHARSVLKGLLLMSLVAHQLAVSVLNDEQRVEEYSILCGRMLTVGSSRPDCVLCTIMLTVGSSRPDCVLCTRMLTVGSSRPDCVYT